MIWLAMLADLIFLCLAFWIFVIILKLFFVKGYRDYPPFVPTFGQTKRLEFNKLSEVLQNSRKSLTVLDPGCGTAGLMIKLAKKFPQHNFVGIEWSKSLYRIASFRGRKLNNTKLLCQDFFDYSFADVDIIVCFLMDPLMKRFGEKIKNEGKKGLVVYSNTFIIPNLELAETIKTRKFFMFGNLYIYKL